MSRSTGFLRVGQSSNLLATCNEKSLLREFGIPAPWPRDSLLPPSHDACSITPIIVPIRSIRVFPVLYRWQSLNRRKHRVKSRCLLSKGNGGLNRGAHSIARSWGLRFECQCLRIVLMYLPRVPTSPDFGIRWLVGKRLYPWNYP